MDYREILKIARSGDLVYMDPPYQGTSNQENPRDNRYIQGVQFDDFVEALRDLNMDNAETWDNSKNIETWDNSKNIKTWK